MFRNYYTWLGNEKDVKTSIKSLNKLLKVLKITFPTLFKIDENFPFIFYPANRFNYSQGEVTISYYLKNPILKPLAIALVEDTPDVINSIKTFFGLVKVDQHWSSKQTLINRGAQQIKISNRFRQLLLSVSDEKSLQHIPILCDALIEETIHYASITNCKDRQIDNLSKRTAYLAQPVFFDNINIRSQFFKYNDAKQLKQLVTSTISISKKDFLKNLINEFNDEKYNLPKDLLSLPQYTLAGNFYKELKNILNQANWLSCTDKQIDEVLYQLSIFVGSYSTITHPTIYKDFLDTIESGVNMIQTEIVPCNQPYHGFNYDI